MSALLTVPWASPSGLQDTVLACGAGGVVYMGIVIRRARRTHASPSTHVAKHCAYCDATASFTRDHVWPAAFLSRIGRGAHFSHKTRRAHGADYVVGDVCANCNNVKLSKLDAYFCRLAADFFLEARDFNVEVTFRFDFDLLARSLLKVAYNSARAAGSRHGYLRDLREYVLEGAPLPRQFAL